MARSWSRSQLDRVILVVDTLCSFHIQIRGYMKTIRYIIALINQVATKPLIQEITYIQAMEIAKLVNRRDKHGRNV